MLSLRVCLRKIFLILFVLSCFLGRSCGFQVISPACRKRKSHQLPSDLKVSAFSPSPLQDSNHASCPSDLPLRNSQRHSLRSLNLHRQPFDEIDLFTSKRSSPLFRPYSDDEFRLQAASNDDGDLSISTRIRSFVSKIYKRLSSPVKRLIRWIRSKFNKMDQFLEETIEEQEKAVEKAIADMEAKAKKSGKDKEAELTTNEKEPNASSTDEVKSTPKVEDRSSVVAPSDTEAQPKSAEGEKQGSDDTVAQEKTAITDGAHTDTAEATKEIQNTDTVETAQMNMTTFDTQTDTLDTVEDIQSKSAALASEQSMLSQLDKPAMEPKPMSSGMQDIVAQEQVATAEAQTEIVEKVEDVQTMDAVLATEEGMLAQLDRPEAADADVMSVMQPSEEQKSTPRTKPVGNRWAVSAPGVDLSGDWSLIISDEFKKDYDDYLKKLGQPFIVRSVALTLIGVTTEHTEQKEEGRTLFIRGTNARGIWERTLVTSGADKMNDKFTPLHVPVDTADDERVEAEAWWEDDGTVHRSWMRGISKYGGGDFESKRYLEEDGKVLVTESTFHPNEKDREDVGIIWRFIKDGETLDS